MSAKKQPAVDEHYLRQLGVLKEIRDTRVGLDVELGGARHYDTLDSWDWGALVRDRVTEAERVAFQAVQTGEIPHEAYEREMILVAALAVAAVESSRRKRGAP